MNSPPNSQRDSGGYNGRAGNGSYGGRDEGRGGMYTISPNVGGELLSTQYCGLPVSHFLTNYNHEFC